MSLAELYKNKFLPIAALLFGAALWGVIWHPYRLLEHARISPATSTWITYFIALLLGLLFLRKNLTRTNLGVGKPYLLIGIAIAAGVTNMAYVLGVVYGEVMRVLLLFYLAPLWTILFARWLLDEELSLHGYLVIALSLAGAITMLWRGGALPVPASFADWMGVLGGFMFALSNVLVRKDQHHSVSAKAVAVWVGVTLIGMTYSLVETSLSPVPSNLAWSEISGHLWLVLLVLGITIFILSVTVQFGLTYTPANQAIVILLFELVVAAIAAYFLADEAMSVNEWVGGAMIVSASVFSARMNRA